MNKTDIQCCAYHQSHWICQYGKAGLHIFQKDGNTPNGTGVNFWGIKRRKKQTAAFQRYLSFVEL